VAEHWIDETGRALISCSLELQRSEGARYGERIAEAVRKVGKAQRRADAARARAQAADEAAQERIREALSLAAGAEVTLDQAAGGTRLEPREGGWLLIVPDAPAPAQASADGPDSEDEAALRARFAGADPAEAAAEEQASEEPATLPAIA
jgi:hypothetical protein